MPAARGLEEHEPEGEEIGARVHRLALYLLGRHVASGAEDGSLARRVEVGRRADGGRGRKVGDVEFRQAEVEHLDAALWVIMTFEA